jgi:short-subunit dehydrogenase
MQIKGIVVGATGSIGKQIVADLSNKNITVASIGRDKKNYLN